VKPTILFISYNGLDDPLTHSQVVGYLRELAVREVNVHLLTFECHLSDAQKRQVHHDLKQSGITWHTCRYHKRPSFLATLYDIAMGILKIGNICRKHKIELIHARNHVTAAMAFVLARLFGYRWIFDLRGLMAEEYVDGGNWRTGDYKFHLTKRMERLFFRDADEIVMLTERIKNELLKTEPTLVTRSTDITVIPCCVDTTRFNITDEQRNAYRAARGWQDKCVITYIGKIGTWYLHDEMARFFAFAWQGNSRFYFQVITQSDPAPLKQALTQHGVPFDAYDIRFVPREQVPLVLSACDAGLSFIRACYSKLSSSPTKNGEYLAAGLPLIINAGIGDGDEQVKSYRLGIILRDFSDDEFQRGVSELRTFLSSGDTQKRCQAFAADKLSLSAVGGPRYAAIYNRLLSHSLHSITTIERTSI
jgi:hypothetical protein